LLSKNIFNFRYAITTKNCAGNNSCNSNLCHNICRDTNEDLSEDSSDDVLNQLNEAEDVTETDHRHDDNGEDSITRNSLLNNYFAR